MLNYAKTRIVLNGADLFLTAEWIQDFISSIAYERELDR